MTKYKNLHYLLVESLSKPETDPIIIVFNGGPGGASLGMNFFAMGPYVSDGTSNLFPFSEYTWAKNASLLFVDNPAGVGFSYAERIFD